MELISALLWLVVFVAFITAAWDYGYRLGWRQAADEAELRFERYKAAAEMLSELDRAAARQRGEVVDLAAVRRLERLAIKRAVDDLDPREVQRRVEGRER